MIQPPITTTSTERASTSRRESGRRRTLFVFLFRVIIDSPTGRRYRGMRWLEDRSWSFFFLFPDPILGSHPAAHAPSMCWRVAASGAPRPFYAAQGPKNTPACSPSARLCRRRRGDPNYECRVLGRDLARRFHRVVYDRRTIGLARAPDLLLSRLRPLTHVNRRSTMSAPRDRARRVSTPPKRRQKRVHRGATLPLAAPRPSTQDLDRDRAA